jgi:hypothetical protein
MDRANWPTDHNIIESGLQCRLKRNVDMKTTHVTAVKEKLRIICGKQKWKKLKLTKLMNPDLMMAP